jgi:signal transduction histidine kinase
MKLFYLIMSLIVWQLIVHPAFAQSPAQDRHFTDSMEIRLRTAKQDTAKAAVLNQLSDYWSEKDSARSVRYALRSLQLSKKDTYYEAAAHFYLGGAYFYNDIEKSEKEYLSVIDLLKRDSSLRAFSLLGRAWHNYGALLQRKDSSKAYMAILLDHTIPLARAAKDTLREGRDYYSVAQVFSNILEYDKAIDYYRQAISLMRRLDKPGQTLAACYTNIAKTLIYKKDYTPAKPYLDSAWTILNAFPPAFDHMDYFMTAGMYYFHQHQWKPAFAALNKALSLARTLHLPYEANSVLFQKYNAYTEAKRYADAKQVLLGIYHDPVSSTNPENRLMFLYNLAQTDARIGNMRSAYNWLSQYAALADSLNDKKIKSDIAGLEIKYQSEKKQREILSLQNENRRQQLILQKNRFANYLLMAGIIFLLLICAIIFILYRNKKRSALQDARLHRQQLKQIEQEHQLKVYDAMLEGQEQERRRMARDLHDGLGGMLAGVKLQLSDIAENHQSENDMELYKVISQLDNSVQELRRIARNMMPETLIRFGVGTALKELCDSLQTPSLRIEFQSYQLSDDMPQPVQITIYRIIQELLTNAVKHGRASNILVQCSQNEDRIFITVEDDGQGFDVNLLPYSRGIGLSNIQNRINYLKGKLDIQTKPGEGTIINVEVNANE